MLPSGEVQAEFSSISSAFSDSSLSEELAVDLFAERELVVMEPKTILQALQTHPAKDLPKYIVVKARLCVTEACLFLFFYRCTLCQSYCCVGRIMAFVWAYT